MIKLYTDEGWPNFSEKMVFCQPGHLLFLYGADVAPGRPMER